MGRNHSVPDGAPDRPPQHSAPVHRMQSILVLCRPKRIGKKQAGKAKHLFGSDEIGGNRIYAKNWPRPKFSLVAAHQSSEIRPLRRRLACRRPPMGSQADPIWESPRHYRSHRDSHAYWEDRVGSPIGANPHDHAAPTQPKILPVPRPGRQAKLLSNTRRA